jgi:tetratricopeptide (TPR) repeat protein
MTEEEQLLTFMALLKAGRKADASRMLNDIIAATPEKAGPYALLIGGMLVQSGQFAEAVPLYEEAIRLNPDDPAAYFYLGVAFHALKQEAECDRVWSDLAQRFPDHALAHYQGALRALKLDRYDEAKVGLQEAIARLPNDHPLREDAHKTLALVMAR